MAFSESAGVRRACPVCGAASTTLRGPPDKGARICSRCGHSFVAALPTRDQLDALYASYGYDGEAGRYSPPFLDRIIDDLVGSFEPHRRTNRLLDVGFGAGGLLRLAKARAWDPHGVEVSAAAVAYGRERAIGTLFEGDFLEVPLERASFDVVVMSELVEHLPDPMPFLRRAAEVLRPGGLLYMTTPHGRGLSGRALEAEWSVLRPPEHLQLFSRESMRRCLSAAGFRRSEIYTQGLLPHELVAKARALLPSSRKAPRPRSADFPDRARKSVDFNGKLSSRRAGRLLKWAANVALRSTALGDSLRVRATR